jgi:two-component system sensor histidine kinase GlrK
MSKEYEAQRDALVASMTKLLESFVDLHEASISTVVTDARRRSEQAGVVTKELVIIALCVGLLLASLATYSILSPLRRLQEHIRQIGLGNFKTAVNVSAPSDLRELVESVGAMAKKLQELDDLKAEFVSHITHELRSPLTAIHAGTQLLLEEIPGPVNGPQRETLDLMVESSRQLIDMISSLLDLSKIDAGMMEYRIVSSDMKRVLDTSVNKIRLLADRERIRIVIEAPRGPLFVPVDEARMQQVLDNLLSNALKFSREGGSIYLRLEPDQKEKVLRISVTDTGRGIAPESIQHIFERFYQGAVRARGGAPGTGIGLALVKRVVEAHGGRIWAESEPGKGTTMTFVLPMSGS